MLLLVILNHSTNKTKFPSKQSCQIKGSIMYSAIGWWETINFKLVTETLFYISFPYYKLARHESWINFETAVASWQKYA